jgi:hypothetical protein
MIIDCYSDDLTAIIDARVQARADRKQANRRRYERRYWRRNPEWVPYTTEAHRYAMLGAYQ